MTIFVVNAASGVLLLISALLFAGTLMSWSTFAQSSNGTGLIGAAQSKQLPPLGLNEGVSVSDALAETQLLPSAQQTNHAQQNQAPQSQHTNISEQLPVTDNISSSSTHTPVASQPPLSDALVIGDKDITAVVVKGSTAPSARINDAISFSDSTTHSASAVTRNLTDKLIVGEYMTWVRPAVQPVTPSLPSGSSSSSSSPPPSLPQASPTGNAAPYKPVQVTHYIVDAVKMDDLVAGQGPSGISTGDGLRVIDNIAILGLKVPPSASKISVTAPPILQVTPDQGAEITFHSTTQGTYSITIKSNEGRHFVRTVDGKMSLGANSALWDGKDTQGNMAPAGSYLYYIRAQSVGGVREPPAEGDGTIVVIGGPKAPGSVQFPVDTSYLLILPIAGAAGAASFLFLRRKKPLTFYLPEEASAVIDDIRIRYPDAAVEDYVETMRDRVRRFKGVTIKSSQEADEDWLAEVAEKAKKLAGVDSLNVNYRGKMLTL